VGRRWLIGMGFTAITALGGLIAVMIEVLSKVHS
jgi:hypothetical protein